MLTILTVVALFLARIGIPLILLIAVGTLIERYQTRREAEAKKIYKLAQTSVETEVKKVA